MNRREESMKLKKQQEETQEVIKSEEQEALEKAIIITQIKLNKAYTKKENLNEDIASMELAIQYFEEELVKMGEQ
jgi:hypothetical protein